MWLMLERQFGEKVCSGYNLSQTYLNLLYLVSCHMRTQYNYVSSN